jgi:hypothetical protein
MAAISAMPQPYLEFAASSFRTIAKACPGAWFLSKCPGQLSQFSTAVPIQQGQLKWDCWILL